jgi:hypothetical protein
MSPDLPQTVTKEEAAGWYSTKWMALLEEMVFLNLQRAWTLRASDHVYIVDETTIGTIYNHRREMKYIRRVSCISQAPL